MFEIELSKHNEVHDRIKFVCKALEINNDILSCLQYIPETGKLAATDGHRLHISLVPSGYLGILETPANVKEPIFFRVKKFLKDKIILEKVENIKYPAIDSIDKIDNYSFNHLLFRPSSPVNYSVMLSELFFRMFEYNSELLIDSKFLMEIVKINDCDWKIYYRGNDLPVKFFCEEHLLTSYFMPINFEFAKKEIKPENIKKIYARFRGLCGKCKKLIIPGTKIVYNYDNKIACHELCL